MMYYTDDPLLCRVTQYKMIETMYPMLNYP